MIQTPVRQGVGSLWRRDPPVLEGVEETPEEEVPVK